MIHPATTTQAQPCLAAGALHGEGACWSVERQRLYWVDIEGRQVHAFDPAAGTDQVWTLAEEPTAIAPRRAGGLILPMGGALVLTDDACRPQQRLPLPPRDPRTRLNDGSCDPEGRFWAGTMDRGEGKHPGIAALYCLGHDLVPVQVLSGVTISNGIVWSADGGTMYYIDTPTRSIRAFLVEGMQLRDARIVVGIDEPGRPDGMAIDAEGMLWVAQYGGGCCCRWDPRTGRCIGRIQVPMAQQVSSCAFGGADRRTCFLTTARKGLTPLELHAQPLAGSLFVAHVDTPGLPEAPFAG